jgi:UPF0755 protein
LQEDKKKPNMLTRKDLYIIASFFGFILGILLFTFYTPNYYKYPSPLRIDINRGESLNDLIDSLYNKKIIPNKFNMKIISHLFIRDRKIRAGRYYIPNGLSYIKLLNLFIGISSRYSQILITLPEGISQSELASIIQRNINIDSARIIELSGNKPFINSLGLNVKNLEGYLLPETYYFYQDYSAEEILRRLKLQMDKIFTPKIEARMKSLNMTRKEILTLASIIDGESTHIPEFKTIAGVYYNRLSKGMLLQADPTIEYLIRGREDNKISLKDLQIDSRFNTYRYDGLPPSPINNPGKDAIMAALFPQKHNYLYFVADGNGGHIFAQTYEQHQKNVEKYRKWLKNLY